MQIWIYMLNNLETELMFSNAKQNEKLEQKSANHIWKSQEFWNGLEEKEEIK